MVSSISVGANSLERSCVCISASLRGMVALQRLESLGFLVQLVRKSTGLHMGHIVAGNRPQKHLQYLPDFPQASWRLDGAS